MSRVVGPGPLFLWLIFGGTTRTSPTSSAKPPSLVLVTRLFCTWICVSQNPAGLRLSAPLDDRQCINSIRRSSLMKTGICLVSPSPGRSSVSNFSGAISWQGRSNLSLQPMISTSSSTSFQTRSVFGPILPINDSVFTSLNLVPIKSDLLRKAGSTCSVVELRIYPKSGPTLDESHLRSRPHWNNRRRHKDFRRRQSSNRPSPKKSPRPPDLPVCPIGPVEYAAGALPLLRRLWKNYLWARRPASSH